MDLAAFDYELPGELIAQEPLADRAGARMLVLHRAEERWEDRRFRDFPEFLGKGDCLVLNDTRVFPARLFGRRAGVHALPIGKKNPKRREYLSGEVEVFLLRAVSPDGRDWEALVRPGRKMPVGERVGFRMGSKVRSSRAGNSGNARCGFTGTWICSRKSRRSGTCRCRRISSGPTSRRIGNGTRRCSRAKRGRWRRLQRGCISRRR